MRPNKCQRKQTDEALSNYEPGGREFQSLAAHHSRAGSLVIADQVIAISIRIELDCDLRGGRGQSL